MDPHAVPKFEGVRKVGGTMGIARPAASSLGRALVSLRHNMLCATSQGATRRVPAMACAEASIPDRAASPTPPTARGPGAARRASPPRRGDGRAHEPSQRPAWAPRLPASVRSGSDGVSGVNRSVRSGSDSASAGDCFASAAFAAMMRRAQCHHDPPSSRCSRA